MTTLGATSPPRRVVREVRAETLGFVAAIDARQLGLALVDLGGGRTRPEQVVDMAVGLDEVLGVGASADAPLWRLHARGVAAAECATSQVRAAFTIPAGLVAAPPVLRGRIVA